MSAAPDPAAVGLFWRVEPSAWCRACSWLGTHLGARLAYIASPPRNPIALELAVATGKLAWPAATVLATAALSLVVLALACLPAGPGAAFR